MCARGPTTRHHNWLGPSRRTPSPPPHPRFIFSLAHLRHMPRPSRPCVCNLAPGPENGRWQHAPCFSSLCPATAHSSFKAKEESGLFSDPLQASCLRHPIPPRLCSPRLYTKLDHKSTHTRVEQHAPTNLVLSVPKTWHKAGVWAMLAETTTDEAFINRSSPGLSQQLLPNHWVLRLALSSLSSPHSWKEVYNPSVHTVHWLVLKCSQHQRDNPNTTIYGEPIVPTI